MSSLVERLRVRSEKRPVYTLDGDSDDELILKAGSAKAKQEKKATAEIERIVRDDVV